MAYFAKLTADGNRHLAGVEVAAPHLVRIKQMSLWDKKKFVVTPYAHKFACAYAYGMETYGGQQGTSSVQSDTNALISAVNGKLNASGWTDGQKALYSYFSRYWEPYYRLEGYSGSGRSAIAYGFDFRHLHLSKLDFSVSLRLFQPSQLYCSTNPLVSAQQAIIALQDTLNGSNVIKVNLVRELPDTPGELGTPESTITLTRGMCNNKTSPTADVSCNGNVLCYCPYDGPNARSGLYAETSIKVWANGNTSASPPQRKAFYTDVTLSSDAANAFFKTNPGKFWLVAQFNGTNGFANGSSGIRPGAATSLYVQRVELNLTCTGPSFNIYDN